MKRTAALLVALFLILCAVFASTRCGIVVAVDNKTFTIKPEVGDKVSFAFAPDLGKKANRFMAYSPLGATPDQIKVGMIVWVTFFSENGDGEKVCCQALIIEEHLGTREIDFASMLPKDKDTLPKCDISIVLRSKVGLGRFRPYTQTISIKEGSSLREARHHVKVMLSQNSQNRLKMKEEGDTRLLIESYRYEEKDEPPNSLEIEVKGLPKEQQPRVRLLVSPCDSTK